MKREDNRTANSLRTVKIKRHYLKDPAGSVLIEFGATKVICTATIQQNVPPHIRNSGTGWITAEYSMLPGASGQRVFRERGKVKGRTKEIERLIGRSLRAVVDLTKLGERSILIDCDVIQADGGTRTASITGAWVALKDAIAKLRKDRTILEDPINDNLAAVSVGIVNKSPLLDLAYCEDVLAEVDMNVVMTESGKFIEVQGTAENAPFTQADLDKMLELAKAGIKTLIKKQKEVQK